MPCNGYVPCQPEQLRPDLLAERMEGAMPCHNYKGGDMDTDSVDTMCSGHGETPQGCW